MYAFSSTACGRSLLPEEALGARVKNAYRERNFRAVCSIGSLREGAPDEVG